MRDYTDLMNMAPSELARHALDCAKVGVLSTALVEALAHQLETAALEAEQADRLRADLQEAEDRATEWQEEARALQRQLDRGLAMGDALAWMVRAAAMTDGELIRALHAIETEAARRRLIDTKGAPNVARQSREV